jgi:hypothetical protein
MKKLLLFFSGLIIVVSLKAQSSASQGSPASKSVYLELLGSGVIFSVNFDSRFKGQNGFGYRVGIGNGVSPSIFIIPLGVNYLTGKGPGHFEAEFTASILTKSRSYNHKVYSTPVLMYPHIGYRHSKPGKSFLWRINAGPLFEPSGRLIPYLGFSLGYTWQ